MKRVLLLAVRNGPQSPQLCESRSVMSFKCWHFVNKKVIHKTCRQRLRENKIVKILTQGAFAKYAFRKNLHAYGNFCMASVLC